MSLKIPFFKESNNGQTILQFIKYLLSGFLSFGVEYGCYVMLYAILHINYIIASVIVYSVVFWLNFLINRFWTFKSKSDIKNQIFLYALLFAFNLVVSNILVMYLLTSVIGINPFISPFLKTGLVVVWNFYFYKKVIYK